MDRKVKQILSGGWCQWEGRDLKGKGGNMMEVLCINVRK
jgi:hypothetical protein